jgi:Tfp pilus assembly protein PilN
MRQARIFVLKFGFVRFRYSHLLVFKKLVIQKLNLSSFPFRNRTLPWLLSLSLFGLSAISFVYFLGIYRNTKAEDSIVKSDTETMETDLKKLKEEGEKVQQNLSPEQRQTLVAAHKLVARKDFSWSRLFADVESVLPPGVSVSKISVQEVYKDSFGTKADLEFAVLSRDASSVLNMIDTMNSSGIFQADLRGQDLQKGETITYTEFTLRLVYSPRTSVPTASTIENSVASTGEVKQ